MTTMETLAQIFLLFGGLGVFLYGLNTMGDSLQKSAGDNLRKVFDKLTSNKLSGVLVGAGSTALIQSSSATTVIVVGFVNAGIIGLSQAVPIIMGANIGTTVTAFIMALPFSEFIAALGCVGAFAMMFSKNETVKKISMILLGFGALFVGLIVMNMAMKPFSPQLQHFFQMTSNPILLLLIGLVFTALIQSSSAATGILIVLASTVVDGVPAISISQAIYVLLGVNIGTCITAFLASLGATANARRAALIHILFNLIGALVIGGLLFIPPIHGFVTSLLGGIPDAKLRIAVFHIVFNILTTALLLPLGGVLVKLSCFLIKDKKADGEDVFKPKYLNDMMLSAPSIAVGQVRKEIAEMLAMASDNFDRAMRAMTALDYSEREIFDKQEENINLLNRIIPEYIVRISARDLSMQDENILSTFYHVVSDLERVGDYAENIMKYTKRMIDHDIEFTVEAVAEIKDMYGRVTALKEAALATFMSGDIAGLARVYSIENSVDICKKMFHEAHIERLNEGKCSAENGAIFISLISNMERIGDHFTNVAKSILSYS